METIVYEILRNSLYAIAREMKIAMMRTAASPIMHLGADASAAVFDAKMQLVAQGNDIPTMLGSAVISTKVSVEAIGRENLRPGDVIISNDAYLGGGNHQPDIQITRPVFFENEIVFDDNPGNVTILASKLEESSKPVTGIRGNDGLKLFVKTGTAEIFIGADDKDTWA